jgi:ABC-2 type transport system ATP-binding protein
MRLHRRRVSIFVAGALIAGLALIAAPTGTAVADPPVPTNRSLQVTSFDGTAITVNFFPATGLKAGERAPTIMYGPGWGGAGDNNPNSATATLYRSHGYNLLTWDPRGFGTSGGKAAVDYYRFEGRDMRVLLSWLAQQPEARLDRPGDPRVGMAGGSYGGGIQFVTAAIDRRVDAIVPTIAWNNLVDSLYPNRTSKTGWGNLLCGAGTAGTNRVADQVAQGCALAATGGLPSPELEAWWNDHGPRGRLIDNVRVPTMIVQGTVDTLFPLAQGIANYRALRSNGVPVKMVWFCGGHGVCLTPSGAAGHAEALSVAWFDRYLKRQKGVATGPGFEYIDETGTWRGASSYPPRSAGKDRATGSGTLAFGPQDTSGNPIVASPAAKAVRISIPAAATGRQAVGTPVLSLGYRGTAAPEQTSLYAQIVDEQRNIVVGNLATPLPLVLDGKARFTRVNLGAIAWSAGPGSKLALQIIAGSQLYFPQRATGSVTVHAVLEVPLIRSGAPTA